MAAPVKRRMSTVFLALILATAGTLAVLWYVHGADQRALAGRQAVTVLVAAKAVPAGTPVARLRSGGYTEAVRMPAGTVPGDVVQGLGGVADLVTGADIRRGELLRRSVLVPMGSQTAGLVVPEGRLAVSVSLTDPQRVGGHLRPGARIAIFATYPVLTADGRPKGELKRTRLLLSDIEVLAVGAPGGTGGAGGSAAKPRLGGTDEATSLVTVAVRQREAEKLIFGTQQTLHFALQTEQSQLDGLSPGVDGFTQFR